MNEPTYKCINCGNKVSYDEVKARTNALLAQGIIPMMVIMCKECRNSNQGK